MDRETVEISSARYNWDKLSPKAKLKVATLSLRLIEQRVQTMLPTIEPGIACNLRSLRTDRIPLRHRDFNNYSARFNRAICISDNNMAW